MKTLIYTSILTLATVVTASAQSTAHHTSADSVLLSERIENNYRISTYRITDHGNGAYAVRYRIHLAMLNDSLGDNSAELKAISHLMSELQRDTLAGRACATITGYASPDGPYRFNAALAKQRMEQMKSYLDTHYNFSQRFDVTTNSVVEDWEACRPLIEKIYIPDRDKVMAIIDGQGSAAAKQTALMRMGSPWSFLKSEVLPPLRRVEVTIAYNTDHLTTVRTRIAEPQPVVATTPKAKCDCTVVDEVITGIIVEVPKRRR